MTQDEYANTFRWLFYRAGKDTYDIAFMYGVHESQVYNALVSGVRLVK